MIRSVLSVGILMLAGIACRDAARQKVSHNNADANIKLKDLIVKKYWRLDDKAGDPMFKIHVVVECVLPKRPGELDASYWVGFHCGSAKQLVDAVPTEGGGQLEAAITVAGSDFGINTEELIKNLSEGSQITLWVRDENSTVGAIDLSSEREKLLSGLTSR